VTIDLDYNKYPEEQKKLINNLIDCLIAIEKNNHENRFLSRKHLVILLPIRIHIVNGPVTIKYD